MYKFLYWLVMLAVGIAIGVIFFTTAGIPEPAAMALIPISLLAFFPAIFVGAALELILCRVFYKRVRLWDGSKS